MGCWGTAVHTTVPLVSGVGNDAVPCKAGFAKTPLGEDFGAAAGPAGSCCHCQHPQSRESCLAQTHTGHTFHCGAGKLSAMCVVVLFCGAFFLVLFCVCVQVGFFLLLMVFICLILCGFLFGFAASVPLLHVPPTSPFLFLA